jgi:hypothetical protein
LAGQTSVDDRDLACLFDEIAIDHIRADLVEGGGELHRRGLPVDGMSRVAASSPAGYDQGYGQ